MPMIFHVWKYRLRLIGVIQHWHWRAFQTDTMITLIVLSTVCLHTKRIRFQWSCPYGQLQIYFIVYHPYFSVIKKRINLLRSII